MTDGLCQEAVPVAEASAEDERLAALGRAVVEPGGLVAGAALEPVVGVQLTVVQRRRVAGRRHRPPRYNTRPPLTSSSCTNTRHQNTITTPRTTPRIL